MKLEREIWRATHKQGVFGCFEVTIGWFGEERVDYMTYDTKGIFRCYEIKVSKSDFHSKAHNTFVGHYNYYVMPEELYEQIKDEIPVDIGVYTSKHNYVSSIKKAKKIEPPIDIQILKDSLIRSLYREVEKQIGSRNPTRIEMAERRARESDRYAKHVEQKYWDLLRKVQEKYGNRWDKE